MKEELIQLADEIKVLHEHIETRRKRMVQIVRGYEITGSAYKGVTDEKFFLADYVRFSPGGYCFIEGYRLKKDGTPANRIRDSLNVTVGFYEFGPKRNMP